MLKHYKNTFSERLLQFQTNYFELLVVDLLHEIEGGVWKAVFTHLLRILIAEGGDMIQELDERYIIARNRLYTHPDWQVSRGTIVWSRYNPEIFEERFKLETNGRKGLRGFITGKLQNKT